MEKDYQLGYYAHSMKIYNTKREKVEMDFIVSNFWGHTICPNKHIGELDGMKPYLDIVKKVDIVFASEFNDFIGMGVFKECVLAQELKIPVYILKQKNNEYHFETLNYVEIVNNFNPVYYGKVISKKTSPKKLPFIKMVVK